MVVYQPLFLGMGKLAQLRRWLPLRILSKKLLGPCRAGASLNTALASCSHHYGQIQFSFRMLHACARLDVLMTHFIPGLCLASLHPSALRSGVGQSARNPTSAVNLGFSLFELVWLCRMLALHVPSWCWCPYLCLGTELRTAQSK